MRTLVVALVVATVGAFSIAATASAQARMSGSFGDSRTLALWCDMTLKLSGGPASTAVKFSANGVGSGGSRTTIWVDGAIQYTDQRGTRTVTAIVEKSVANQTLYPEIELVVKYYERSQRGNGGEVIASAIVANRCSP